MSKSIAYELLEVLPTYGPMHISINTNGEPFYNEGYPVRFYKNDGSSWVANFLPGWSNCNKVFKTQELIIVFAKGYGYFMNPNFEKPAFILDSMCQEVYQINNDNLVCLNELTIQIVDINTFSVWTSERISWDGFKDIQIEDNIIIGKSYNPTNSSKHWTDFSFNIDTKEIIGGSYRQ